MFPPPATGDPTLKACVRRTGRRAVFSDAIECGPFAWNPSVSDVEVVRKQKETLGADGAWCVFPLSGCLDMSSTYLAADRDDTEMDHIPDCTMVGNCNERARAAKVAPQVPNVTYDTERGVRIRRFRTATGIRTGNPNDTCIRSNGWNARAQVIDFGSMRKSAMTGTTFGAGVHRSRRPVAANKERTGTLPSVLHGTKQAPFDHGEISSCKRELVSIAVEEPERRRQASLRISSSASWALAVEHLVERRKKHGLDLGRRTRPELPVLKVCRKGFAKQAVRFPF